MMVEGNKTRSQNSSLRVVSDVSSKSWFLELRNVRLGSEADIDQLNLHRKEVVGDCGGTLTITQQSEHLFRGIFSWSVDPTTGIRADVNRRVSQKGTEDVLGLLAWNNKSISMADAADKWCWSGQLVDDQTMKLIYTESQRHAAVFRATFIQEKEQAKPAK